MKQDPNSYSPRERTALIAAIEAAAENGKSVVRTARELGITAAIYYRWLRERAKGEPPTSEPAPERLAPAGGYPEPRRRELVAEIRQLVAQGRTIEAAAQAVGITGKTYYNWTRRSMTSAPELPASAMRPVELVAALAPVEAPAASTLTLIVPGGYRVEGLTAGTAAELLRALA